MQLSVRVSIFLAGWVFSGLLAHGTDQPGPPESEEQVINFEQHIKPIFREHCTVCHSQSNKESDLALDTYGGALSGGSSGEVISAGDPGSSRLFALVAHAERPFMPPDEEAIPKEQRQLIQTWIEQGMPENSGSKIKRLNTAAAAMLGDISLGKPDGPPPMPNNLLRQPLTETDRSAAISAMAASPWAPLIALGGQQQVSLYHSESGELLGIIPFPEGEPQSLTFTRDGRQLLIGGGQHAVSGCAVLVDIETGKRVSKVGDELDIVLAADVSPNKQRIAIAGPQKIVRIHDSVTGELVFEMEKHTDWVFALRYSPDGVLLASGDRSNGLVVWEADTGRLYADLIGHKDAVRSLDFRADSNVLASGSLDGTIKLWDMYENKAIKSWDAHRGGVTSVAYAHDGSIASAGRDSTIKLWDGNGKLQREFKGLSDAVLEVALTGDAAFVAGGDWNGQAQIWPADDPQEGTLIAANPISIQSRLKLASAAFEEAQAEWTEAAELKKSALHAEEKAGEKLAAAESQAAELASLLDSQEQLEVELEGSVDAMDKEIQQLENQLAGLRKQRQTYVSELASVRERKSSLRSESEATTKRLSEAKALHARTVAKLHAAQEQVANSEARLAAARHQKRQAEDDLAALESATAAVHRQHEQAAARASGLARELKRAKSTQESSTQSIQQIASQLESLQQELQELQERISATARAEEGAREKLKQAKQETQRLQSEWEAAEQAVFDAQQRLELFEQAYKFPR